MKKILLIEDELQICEVIEEFFSLKETACFHYCYSL